MKKDARILQLYRELLKNYNKPSEGWSLWCKRPKTQREKEEVIIGTILTQRTSWKNVEIAMSKLKNNKLCTLQGIAKNTEKIPECIRSAGFYNQKSRYLIELARYIIKNGGIKKLSKKPIEDLRKELLSLRGIGPETADSIILYALEKPAFVIDEYTRRLVGGKGISKEKGYEKLRELFEKNLPRDWKIYQDLHALIVREGKIANSNWGISKLRK